MVDKVDYAATDVKGAYDNESADVPVAYSAGAVAAVPDLTRSTQRVMNRRQVQLYSIGGVIGTAVFMSIGTALTRGGPLSLLMAYIAWCAVIYFVNECQAEMVCILPIESSFNRYAARWVDDAFGLAVTLNYLLCMVSLFVFEIVAFHGVVQFWTVIHPAILPTALLVSYAVLHLWSAKVFAESEFYIVLMKITLMVGLFIFTFVTMLGGNPLGDRFGFRSWKDPGPAAEWLSTGSAGYFHGFMACLLNAAFAVAGPDMLSLIAGEARSPRTVMPFAFRSVFYRLIFFFIMSALSVGILIPSNDPIMLDAIANGSPGAGRSPYVAAMTRLQIPVLPHIVNAGILTSVYSAGSAFFFNGSRVLHALAVDGYMPSFVAKTTKRGVPWVACLVILAFGCLSYLQCSASTSKVLDWFISISASCQLVTWAAFGITWLRWKKARDAQGYTRDSQVYKSWCQPYAAYIAVFFPTLITLVNGYTVFLNDSWATADFIFAYFSPLAFVFVMLVRKAYNRRGPIKAGEADLVSGMAEIDQHEIEEAEKRAIRSQNPNSKKSKIVGWIF